MLNPIYLDYLLALSFTNNDVNTIANGMQTEKQLKEIENKFLHAWDMFDGYNDEDELILLPYAEKQDVNVTPNEYSNIFAFNRCLRHLFENDVKVFNDIGIYATLLTWSTSQEYYVGNRVLYPIYSVFKSSDKYKIYICVKPHVIGKDVIPDSSNTMSYYESLYYETLPDNIVWVEDIPFMSSFLIDTGNLSLKEFNKKIITSLPVFKYSSTIADTVENTDFTKTVILTNNQFRKLYDNTKNMSWPDNRPVAYTDFSVSTCLVDNALPASLYYLEPAEEINTYISNANLNDYVVSAITEEYTIENKNISGTRWLRLWNSGWVEQGGIFGIRYNSINNELDNIVANKITGDTTYLIGIHPTANFLCKAEISPILSFTDNVELFNINANIQNVVWGTIDSDNNFTVNKNIYSDIINSQFVLNQAETYSSNLNTHYTNATFCFTGTCFDTESTNTYKLCSALDYETSAVISWEMQGILQ